MSFWLRESSRTWRSGGLQWLKFSTDDCQSPVRQPVSPLGMGLLHHSRPSTLQPRSRWLAGSRTPTKPLECHNVMHDLSGRPLEVGNPEKFTKLLVGKHCQFTILIFSCSFACFLNCRERFCCFTCTPSFLCSPSFLVASFWIWQCRFALSKFSCFLVNSHVRCLMFSDEFTQYSSMTEKMRIEAFMLDGVHSFRFFHAFPIRDQSFVLHGGVINHCPPLIMEFTKPTIPLLQWPFHLLVNLNPALLRNNGSPQLWQSTTSHLTDHCVQLGTAISFSNSPSVMEQPLGMVWLFFACSLPLLCPQTV